VRGEIPDVLDEALAIDRAIDCSWLLRRSTRRVPSADQLYVDPSALRGRFHGVTRAVTWTQQGRCVRCLGTRRLRCLAKP
jgi:hypothetical protein